MHSYVAEGLVTAYFERRTATAAFSLNLPKPAEVGQIIQFDESGNRYLVREVTDKGCVPEQKMMEAYYNGRPYSKIVLELLPTRHQFGDHP